MSQFPRSQYQCYELSRREKETSKSKPTKEWLVPRLLARFLDLKQKIDRFSIRNCLKNSHLYWWFWSQQTTLFELGRFVEEPPITNSKFYLLYCFFVVNLPISLTIFWYDMQTLSFGLEMWFVLWKYSCQALIAHSFVFSMVLYWKSVGLSFL